MVTTTCREGRAPRESGEFVSSRTAPQKALRVEDPGALKIDARSPAALSFCLLPAATPPRGRLPSPSVFLHLPSPTTLSTTPQLASIFHYPTSRGITIRGMLTKKMRLSGRGNGGQLASSSVAAAAAARTGVSNGAHQLRTSQGVIDRVRRVYFGRGFFEGAQPDGLQRCATLHPYS